MLGLLENVLLLIWVMATTWILLDLRSKVYAMEAVGLRMMSLRIPPLTLTKLR